MCQLERTPPAPQHDAIYAFGIGLSIHAPAAGESLLFILFILRVTAAITSQAHTMHHSQPEVCLWRAFRKYRRRGPRNHIGVTLVRRRSASDACRNFATTYNYVYFAEQLQRSRFGCWARAFGQRDAKCAQSVWQWQIYGHSLFLNCDTFWFHKPLTGYFAHAWQHAIQFYVVFDSNYSKPRSTLNV